MIEEMTEQITNKECIQDELPKYLKHKDEMNRFFFK